MSPRPKKPTIRKQKTLAPSEEHESHERPTASHPRTVAGLCVALALGVLMVFGQTVRHDFVNFDDEAYVSRNSHINKGLTREGIVRAFTHGHAGNWHPLTSMSHMLDCQLYGLNAAGHHLTSVLLHAAAAILLFLVLREMTGALWPSAFVAAVFAIHPLRAESVAWVAERKDVLSGLFFMLTLGAYVRYVRHPFTLWRYLAVALCLALGLMSKPMLVTLPFVLLLLDYWPLGRLKPGSHATESPLTPSLTQVLLEKIPLLALSVAASAATVMIQTGAMAPADYLPLSRRIGNALISYVTYLTQMFYPVGLAVFYPYRPQDLRLWEAALALVLLTAISAGAFVLRRTRPYLLVGWLWYLGMLVPVIGFIQVGGQAYADRYTYLPQIGIALLVAWAVKDISASWPYRRQALGAAGLTVTFALMVAAWIQTSYWRTSESLWTRTLVVTPGNGVAHNSLGMALETQGRAAEALQHYQTALGILPDFVLLNYNMGRILFSYGRVHESVPYFQRVIQIGADDERIFALAHYYLGVVLIGQGRPGEAIAHLQVPLRVIPDDAKVHNNMGAALAGLGRLDEAIERFRKAVRLDAAYAEAYYNLGAVLTDAGRLEEAIDASRRALRIKPDYARAHVSLGRALVTQGKTAEAIEHFRRAVELKPDYSEAWIRLHLAQNSLGKPETPAPQSKR